MKPAFALDFRNDAIALLHRTSGGWQQVGRVTFDEPDLAVALSYLRSTALGLDPRGLATKLILPDEQMLLTTVDAPGPDDATRLAQIRAALDGRTPYAVEDLVFDWQEVEGTVHVAVIARETLAEAEGFAVEHRFNPVGFVAAPAAGFTKEPWFGPSSLAADLLADGDSAEPDAEVVRITTREVEEVETAEPPTVEEPAATEEVAIAADARFDETLSGALHDDDDWVVETDSETGVSAVTEDAPGAANAVLADAPAAHEADANDTAPPADLDSLNETVITEEPVPTVVSEPEPSMDSEDLLQSAEDVPEPEAQVAADPTPTWHDLREQPLFGVADDELPPSAVFRGDHPSKGQDFPTTGSMAIDGAKVEKADATADLPDDLAATLQKIDLEEAPMAFDVVDDDELQPQGLGAQLSSATDWDNRLEPEKDAALTGSKKSGVTDMSIPDDVPSVPGYTPALGFASRRASADPGQGDRAVLAAPRPSVPRPVAAKPLAPVPMKADRPATSRPTAAKPVVAKMSKGLRGLGALVSAPSQSATRGKRVDIPTAQAPVAKSAAADTAAFAQGAAQTLNPASGSATGAATGAATGVSSLGRHIGRRQTQVRGKPRYLGLVLTLILLLVLAVIAAWSTTLAFRDKTPDETQLADVSAEAGNLPAPEDEMAADGLDPAELTDAAPLPETEPVADEAPALVATETAEASDTVVVPGVASGDEIFLAAKNPPPAVLDPVAPPPAAEQSDPLPVAQAPPPPFGTVYQFDANGLIVPTPEGIVTPEGVLLIAGKPPVVPKARSTAVQPEAALVTPEESGTFADPALAGFRPKTRPEGLTPPADVETQTEKPDDAALPPDATNRLAGLRPKARPEAVLAAGDAARVAKAAAAASLATAPKTEPEAASSASKLAVAISRRPAPRPRDLSRAVEAAVAAAVRAPEPKPEPEQTASLQPRSKPAAKPEPKAEQEPTAKEEKSATQSPKGGGRDGDLEADEEPELPSVKVGKSSGSVAKQATFKNALNLSKTALIGVYGTPSKRYAMIRTANGRYKKVKVGDQVDGGRIQAITASEVRYQKGSKLVTLGMPRS